MIPRKLDWSHMIWYFSFFYTYCIDLCISDRYNIFRLLIKIRKNKLIAFEFPDELELKLMQKQFMIFLKS